MATELQAIALSIPAFCRTYGIGRSKTYELISDGTLDARKFGAKTLIDSASAEAWYTNLPGFSPAARIVKMRATMSAPAPPNLGTAKVAPHPTEDQAHIASLRSRR